MLQHNHLLIRAEVNRPIKEERILKKWLKDLVHKIDMNIIKGPYVKYVDKVGKRGITGFVMIETSHIAIHIWDETDPALVQFDIYSCANFSIHEVVMHLAPMKPIKIEHLFIDRENKFNLEKLK